MKSPLKKRSFRVVAILVLVTMVVLFFPIGYYRTNQNEEGLGIVRYPAPGIFRKVIKEIPQYDSNSTNGWQVDLRSADLTALRLDDRGADLQYADFDSNTKWPSKLPYGFSPDEIMEVGKNPGLNIRELHKQSINGQGVGIAIIDQGLLVDHVEYKENLKLYEEIHSVHNQAPMHGAAVASIAVGKSIGVAPGADLYYIAGTPGQYRLIGYKYDFRWMAKSIERILEVNKTLPEGKKIRVISISLGWGESKVGYSKVMDAVEKAKQEGIFVVSSSLKDTHGLSFHGLGREIDKNPEDFKSYEPGLWWNQHFLRDPGVLGENTLLVPMDSRTTASPTGVNDYVFYRQGGWSWAIPYISGLYALACQVDPDITPEVFWEKALETGSKSKIENHEFGIIVNPVKLMEAIKEM